MKRLMIICGILACAFLLSALNAHAGGKLITGQRAKEIEEILSWAPGNPQGEAVDGKVAYVIGGLRCPITTKVLERSGELADKIQLRWIFPQSSYSVKGAEYINTEPMPKAYSDYKASKRRSATPLQEATATYYKIIDMAIPEVTGYPSIIYKTDKGIRITSAADDLLNEMSSVRPMEANYEKSLGYLKDISKFPKKKGVDIKNRSGKTIPNHPLPDEESPVLPIEWMQWEPGVTKNPCYSYNDEYYTCGKGWYNAFYKKSLFK